MMTIQTRILAAGLLTLFLAACSDTHAPIEDLGRQYYGRGNSPSDEQQQYGNGTTSYHNANATIYSQPVQSAEVPSVGESDLPPVQANQKRVPAYNSVDSYNNNNDTRIVETNTDSSSPFKAPSKPLEQPYNAPSETNAGGATAAAATAPGKVYAHDSIDLIWPVVGGKIISHFKGMENDGINIAIAEGEPVVAAASGTVVYSGSDLKDYGNMVILRHDNSWLTAYADASRIVVKKGQHIKQGDIIAYVGSTGNVKSPQLHFALRKGTTPVDPEKYLPKQP